MKEMKMFGMLTAKFAAIVLAFGLTGGAWGESASLPQAHVVKMTTTELEQQMTGATELMSSIPVYGFSGSGENLSLNLNQVGTTSASEAFIFTAEQESTDQEVMDEYGSWNCDYVVTFDDDVDANSVILAGYYSNMLMAFLVPQNFRGSSADELFLLSSVMTPWSYWDIVNSVGTFVCTAVNVSKENIGKKITVSLVMWPSTGDRVKDRKVVTSITYEFTASNLSTLDVSVPNLGTVPFVYVSTGLDTAYGMTFDEYASLVKQTVAGPHFSPNYAMDVKEPDATGDVVVDIDVTSGAGGAPSTVASVKVSANETTTIGNFSVEKVVGEAVGAGKLTVGNMQNTIVIGVAKQIMTSAASAIEYNVKPVAVVNNDTEHPLTLSNDDLSSGASFAFDLDVTGLGVAVGGWVKVTHVSSDSSTYPTETSILAARTGENGHVVVHVVTSHFSTFTVEPSAVPGTTPCVTNSVVSANCFGALTIGGTAKPAYVAVPFGAFGDGDAQIAAADIVQAAALSNGDKMYVWNGTEGGQQKYEVYTVSGGAWTAAKKVTVAADGTQTEGSVSPDAFPVASGKGVFIERADTSKPLYVYGQVLTNATAKTTFEAGLTLVSAPSTKAMGEIDLNSLTWNGVKTLPTKTARGKTYPDWSKINDADYIYFRNAAGSTIKCYYSNGKWVTENGSTVVKVPAGTAFWYSGKAAGAEVTW